MATNPPKGDGHRQGAVKGRSQLYNPKTGNWTKRSADSGKFVDSAPLKGVREAHIGDTSIRVASPVTSLSEKRQSAIRTAVRGYYAGKKGK
jgi:hypothetical protein